MNYLIKLNACAGSQSFEVDLTDDELRGVEKVAEMSQCAEGCAPRMSVEKPLKSISDLSDKEVNAIIEERRKPMTDEYKSNFWKKYHHNANL